MMLPTFSPDTAMYLRIEPPFWRHFLQANEIDSLASFGVLEEKGRPVMHGQFGLACENVAAFRGAGWRSIDSCASFRAKVFSLG